MDFNKLADCKRHFGAHAWTRRVLSELDYALQLGGDGVRLAGEATEILHADLAQHGALTFSGCRRAEQALLPLGPRAKGNAAICVSHAHIDMNWLWGFEETAAITLSTVETMLQLLERYPQFCFSQSQAAVYRIVEKLRPDLLERIRGYVREGRWEITAGAWVECDKNLPGGESLTRQITFTRNYLTRLFGLPDGAVDLDFEPDTFGHSALLPSILARNGIRYYYHCRGNDLPPLYRWQAGSDSVLVYREPMWYNAAIGYGDFNHVPDFCRRYGADTVLKVYGVGDHGGGATVRDIERLTEMQQYPVFPDIRFGTYREFFRRVERIASLPVACGEQNPIFSGCYTSQSLIKAGNAMSERNLLRAEFISALGRGGPHTRALLDAAWERVLFNQFHDILPGSGKESTRSFALGLYQQADAASGAVLQETLAALAAEVDTTQLLSLASDTAPAETALGAGGGYRAAENNFSCSGHGPERAFLLFHTGRARTALVALDVWDYAGDVSRLAAYDALGNRLPCRQRRSEAQPYWSHNVHTLDVAACLPSYGYTCVVLRPEPLAVPTIKYPPIFERTDAARPLVLQNAYLRAEFDDSLALVSLKDSAGTEHLASPARFHLAQEDGGKNMSAWVVGRTMESVPLAGGNVTEHCADDLESWLSASIPFGSSRLTLTVSLAACERILRFRVECDFFERGVFGERVPKLEFRLPLAVGGESADYAVPFGVLNRPSGEAEVCSHGLCHTEDAGGGVTLYSDTKYGFGYHNRQMTLDCLRASFDPDPLPEYGTRCFQIGLSLGPRSGNELLAERREFVQAPLAIPVARHPGNLPPQGSLLDFAGEAFLSSVSEEDGKLRIVVVNADAIAREAVVCGKPHRVPARDYAEITVKKGG